MMTLAMLPALLATGPSQSSAAPADTLTLVAQHIVTLLKVTTGESAAFLGSGGRLFAMPLAAAAGTGTVYVVDVDADALADVRRLAQTTGRANIQTRDVGAGGPPLDRPVDSLTLVDTWQHLQSTPQYFRALGAMLAPGGRLAVIDLSAPYRVIETDIAQATAAAGFARLQRHRVSGAEILIFTK